jgi:hypothetical protein
MRSTPSKGLGDVAEDAALHGVHRIGNGAVGRQDQHRQQREAAVHGLEQLQPVHARHAQVGDEDVGQLMVQPGQGLRAAVGLDHLVAFVVKAQGQQPEQCGSSSTIRMRAIGSPSATRASRRPAATGWLLSVVMKVMVAKRRMAKLAVYHRPFFARMGAAVIGVLPAATR